MDNHQNHFQTDESELTEAEYTALERYLSEKDEELDGMLMLMDENKPVPYPNDNGIFWLRRSSEY